MASPTAMHINPPRRKGNRGKHKGEGHPMGHHKGHPVPGHMPLPHGPSNFHFQHGQVHGNGFNGAIRHMWGNPHTHHVIPGKGILPIHHAQS